MPDSKIIYFDDLIGFIEKATNIMSFCPKQDEPNIWPLNEYILHKKGKIICPKIEKGNILPCVVENFDELSKGKRGILEPKHCKIMDLHQIDIILVPGTKFDKYGHKKGGERVIMIDFCLKFPKR